MFKVDLIGGPLDGERGEYEIFDGRVAVFFNGFQEDYYFGQRLSTDGKARVFYHGSHPEGQTIGIDRTIASVRSQYPSCEIDYKINDFKIDFVLRLNGEIREGSMVRMTSNMRHERPTLDNFRHSLWDWCREIAGPPVHVPDPDLVAPDLPQVP